jgi:NAD(P)-dependent dehydrogenase (short-subunit alcohol dehydrogenase family)
MAKLSGKIALVAGGTGAVGEGIVKSLLEEDATVIVPSRTEDKIIHLRKYVGDAYNGKLITMIAHTNTKQGTDEVRREIEERFGRLDIIVASLGGWWQGAPLYEMNEAAWHNVVHNNLHSHFYVVSSFVSMLVQQGHGTYVHINGFSAEQAYPGAGAVAMMAAAQLHMMRTLEQELEQTGVRSYELILGPVITRMRPQGRLNWYHATEIGKYIVELQNGTSSNTDTQIQYLLEK